MTTDRQHYYRLAYVLALVTVIYNIIEGVIAIFFGINDETLTLLGFGIDSFVEVISGVGIWHMIRRIKSNPDENPDRFEQRALRITGSAFYLLTLGLVATASINLYTGHAPLTTLWGTVISLVSIALMWLLIRYKLKAGEALNSQAIIADAHCSRACMHFSLVLLVSSVAYQLTGIGYIDAIGGLGIAWLAFKEGREAFAKARGISCCSSCGCGG